MTTLNVRPDTRVGIQVPQSRTGVSPVSVDIQGSKFEVQGSAFAPTPVSGFIPVLHSPRPP
jgi:hypothetical protein